MNKSGREKPTKYKHIFLDLDNTLWNFDFDVKNAFSKLISENDLLNKLNINSQDIFIKAYKSHNKKLWEQYKNEEITKEQLCFERFKRPLEDFGCHNTDFANTISKSYLDHLSSKVTLIAGANDILEYLKEKYLLYVITNGFEEIQFKKLDKSGLKKYFTKIITSELAGAKKPNPEIYKYALKSAGANVYDSLMIGDDPESDIIAASEAGLDQCFFDFGELGTNTHATYTIKKLDELKNFL